MDNVKAEKANAKLRYRRLRKMANLLRCLEVFVALILLSWFSTRLPIAVRISGQFFRELCVVLVSPRFVFLVGNAIVLTLFAKSGQFFAHGGLSPNTSTTDNLYDEFVKKNQKPRPNGIPLPSPATDPVPEEFAYVDKDTMHEEEGVRTLTQFASSDPKIIFRRSQSENMKLESKANEKPRRELRRSETENCRNIKRDAEKAEEGMSPYSYAEENMSDEEFNRTIEAFIARQQKFQREEESMDIVLQHHW